MYGTRKSLAKRLPLGSRVVCALVALALAGLVVNDAAVSQSDPAVVGEWGSLKDWRATETSLDYDLSPIHAVLTPEGKVLFWGWGTCPESECPTVDNLPDDVTLWDPVVDSFTEISYPDSLLFCAGQAMMPDGSIFAAGGGCCQTNFTDEARVYGAGPQPWQSIEPMERIRYYPTVTTLPDGRMMVSSGDDLNGTVTYPEIYDPSASQDPWESLDQDAAGWPWYPFMFVLPSGDVFFAGPGGWGASKEMHWVLDLDTGLWTSVVESPSSENPSISSGAIHSAAMYAPGKIMKAGAGVSYTIDMTASSPSWDPHATMQVDRHDHDLVLLPNGWVMAVGGNASESEAEWTDPTDNDPGQWSELAEMHEDILGEYHSIALLLPDSRVLVAGGADFGTEQMVSDSARAQIFSPPFLFWGDRPRVGWAPGNAQYDSAFTVTLDSSSPVGVSEIDRVTLVRTGAVTHSFDHNQRFIELDFELATSAGSLSVTSPLNANLAPPGYYMLFLISDEGVPSHAEFIQLRP